VAPQRLQLVLTARQETLTKSTTSALQTSSRRDWPELDLLLLKALEDSQSLSPGGWTYASRPARAEGHSFFQYPAMMVPAMQGELIDAVTRLGLDIRNIYDPFVGSGIVMTEAMRRGLNFCGQDINPLAIAICMAKSRSFDTVRLREQVDLTLLRLRHKPRSPEAWTFPNLAKWFSPTVVGELAAIRAAIRLCDSPDSRTFMWIALAETVRLTSNSRTTTFKLHARPAAEIARRALSPLILFRQVAEANLDRLIGLRRVLEAGSFLVEDRYRHDTVLSVGDSVVAGPHQGHMHDLLITSPPYGDNLSTVPYGQHSYLPLQWVDTDDLLGSLDRSFLRTTQELDRRSLGGRNHATAIASANGLLGSSEAYQVTMRRLSALPPDRSRRVAAFLRDLATSIPPILSSLKANSYMFWTVGNRRVGGELIPTDQVLADILEANNAVILGKIPRPIPMHRKRMALKNSLTLTMSSETVVVARTQG